MTKFAEIRNDLKKYIKKDKVELLARYFKTGKGQYGEGDIFIGIMVPDTRRVAKKYCDADFETIYELIYSKIHEERLCALLILVEKFRKADQKGRREVFNFYIKNSKQVNNWDLVDLSAPRIVGEYLYSKDSKIVYKFSKSKNLWQRRIAMLATFNFIGKARFADALKIGRILLKDKEDLINKAVGWMLREVGKRDIKKEEEFLLKNIKDIPRVTLRYAIERLPEAKRQEYLKK